MTLRRHAPRAAWLFLSVPLLAGLGGCPWPPFGNVQGGEKDTLKRFSSPEEFLNFFRQQVLARTSGFGRFGAGGFWLPLPGAAPAATGAEDGANQAAGDTSYSTTNLQEEGVDESDVFKSDGEHFFIARGQTLHVVRASPADALAQTGQVDVGVEVDSLYLAGSKVIVIGARYAGSDPGQPEIMIWPPYRTQAEVVVAEVDVSDPNAPVLGKQIEVDGSLVSSRLTGNRLYLVIAIVPNLPPNPTALNMALISLDQVLPRMSAAGVDQPVVEWSEYYYPESGDGYYTTAVVTLDAADVTNRIGATAILANAGTVYASAEALYTTNSEFSPTNDYRETTAVHKFRYDAEVGATYVGTGSVPGRPLNQFSLSEHQGHLRIATHVGAGSAAVFGTPATGVSTADGSASTGAGDTAQSRTQSFNALYVLRESDGELVVTGAVENIAPGETLYAARFVGDHGFMVTFRKIDPLFILDLADPNAPKLLSELKVPGFSDYLHPLGTTHLIGVGKYSVPSETGSFDWYQGVQVSLFDVSDWSKPTAVQQLTFGGRGSECDVSQTHKAFTFLPDRNLLALPMRLTTQNDLPWEYGDPASDEVHVFQVDPASGFTELGRVRAVSDGTSEPWYGWGSDWRRAAFIGETVYALSPDGVRAAPLPALEPTSTVELADTAP